MQKTFVKVFPQRVPEQFSPVSAAAPAGFQILTIAAKIFQGDRSCFLPAFPEAILD
jgi:hypothetical protein